MSFLCLCKNFNLNSSNTQCFLCYKGKPQSSQSDPPWPFSNVQCGQNRTLDLVAGAESLREVPLPLSPLPPPPLPLAAASSAAIWSNTSAGISKSSALESMGSPEAGAEVVALSEGFSKDAKKKKRKGGLTSALTRDRHQRLPSVSREDRIDVRRAV